MSGRLVLLEILNTDRYRNYRSQLYPFLQAFLRGRGIEVRWLAIGVPARDSRAGGNLYTYDLDVSERAIVSDALRGFGPGHVVLNERLEDGAWSWITAEHPEASFRMIDSNHSDEVLGDICRWIGLDPAVAGPENGFLEDLAVPDFSREPLNDLATEVRPFVHLMVGPECVYARSIALNPWFEGVDLEGCLRSTGCSFCLVPNVAHRVPRTPVLELATRQVLAAEATVPEGFRNREYQVHGVTLWFQVDTFFRELVRLGVPASEFHFGARFDEFLRMYGRLDAVLPEIERAGHSICLFNIGIENFSPSENERFNKGLTPEVIDRGLDLIDDLERRFPRGFRHREFGGTSYILFTPWTTLDDLRINIEQCKMHGVDADDIFLDSALQLLPGLALTRLAEKDGLIAQGFVDHPYDSGCISAWDQVEIPWRFRHPEIAMVYRVGRRLAREADVPVDDPERVLVRQWFEGLPDPAHDRLRVFSALLDVIGGDGRDRPVAQVLGEIEQRLGVRSRLDPRRFIGDEPSGGALAELAKEESSTDAWERLVEGVRDTLRSSAGARRLLGDFVIEEINVKRLEAHFGMEIILSRGALDLAVTLETAREDRPRFLTGDRFVLSYQADGDSGSPPTGSLKRAIQNLLGIVEYVYEKQQRTRPG